MNKLTRPVDVFLSYAHEDEPLRDRLVQQLARLEQEGLIRCWHDRRIGAGVEWKDTIEDRLNAADLILMLVSDDYLRSEFCRALEIPRALERHERREARVIPVILRACGWQETALAGLQALPGNGKPVAERQCSDEAMADIVEGVRTAARSIQTHPLPSIWNVPYRRNPHFTGRSELLAALRSALNSGQPAAGVQAVHGLGGVGKTQLAVEYAYRHASDYALVWWLRAEEPATLAGDYARLADPLDLPLKAEKDQSLIVLAVRRWLETNRGWLLVFDNVEKPDDLREYLPQTAQGHIVVTSRNPGWRNIGKTLSVEVLPREQATQLLLRRSGSRDAAAADTLAEELGDLPLALEQAAAYADETACSLTRYLELFRTHREVVLKRRGVTQDYPASVAATWEISFRHLEQESPAAAELLNLCAFLAPEAMPLDLIAEGRQHLPEALKAALGGPVATDELKAALRRYSLASVQGDDITLHRLVQAVARDRMDEKRQQGWAASAVQLMRTLFPEDDEDVRNWPTESRLLPHMSAAADHAASRGVASEDAVATMSRVGAHLNVRAQFTEAEALLTRATALGERALGPQHAGYARALCNLAQYYDGQGRYQEGEPLASRAVEVYSRVLTSDHPDLATALNVLARFRKAQGRSTEVEDLHLRSLAIRERRFGKKSPEVAEALHNLGTQYYIVGRFAEAEGLLRRALSLREELLGPDHPVTAGSMTNLALLYSDVGKATDARYWIERAHRIVECTFDSRHPRVAVSLHNRACVCHSQGENVEALMYFWRSIRIWKNVYGPDRPTIALSLNGLALVCRFQGRFARAESLCRRAVAIWVKAVGPDGPHQYLAEVLQNLGAIHVAQRRFAEAEVELGRALEMQERILLSNHPDVADTLGIMGQLYDKTGRHSEAKAMRERAVRIREKQQEKG